MDGTFISFRRAIKCLQIYDLAWSQSLDQSDYNPANRNPAMPRSYVSLLIWTYVICQKLIATVPQSSTQHSHLRIANVYSEIKLKYNMIKVWRANNFEVDHIRDSLWWKTVWCIFGVFWKCPALDLVTGTLGSHDCWTLSSCFFSPSLSWCIPPREPLVGCLATAHSVHSLKNCTVPSGAAGPRCFTQEPWPAVSSQISSVTLCLPRGSLLDQAGARFLISTSPPGFPPSILLSWLLYWFCLRPFCQWTAGTLFPPQLSFQGL